MKDLKKLVAKHGEKHRQLIMEGLTWFEKQKPDPGRKRRLIGPETFIDALIERLETEKLWHFKSH